MTANEVVERIKKNLGVPWNERTYRDTFKAGDPETEVKGIATTFMATLDLLERAHAAGMNFVITHEPTFWSDTDAVKDLGDDSIYRSRWISAPGTIWWFGDSTTTCTPGDRT